MLILCQVFFPFYFASWDTVVNQIGKNHSLLDLTFLGSLSFCLLSTMPNELAPELGHLHWPLDGCFARNWADVALLLPQSCLVHSHHSVPRVQVVHLLEIES